MKHTTRRPARKACREHITPRCMKMEKTPARVSPSWETWRAFELADAALNAARVSVPTPNRDRAKLAPEIDRIRAAMRTRDLAALRGALARIEENPLAHAEGHFPAALAWARFLGRVAPEQTALAL